MRIAIHDYAGHPFQFELSRELAKRGHVVRHFFFADDPGPKGSGRVLPDDPAGLSIEPIRIGMTYRKDRFLQRCLADHLYGRAAFRRITAFRPDVVISGNTPLDAQRAVSRAARTCGAGFVFWVQDFYGLAIERLLSGRWRGMGTLIARYYRRIETRLLEISDSIVLISPDFRRFLPASVENRVHVIRNWGMLASISPRPKSNPWAARQGLSEKFVFMYTGTLALKHDPGVLLALCDAFDADEAVAVVVVATGVNAERLKAEHHAKPRRNLTLLPLQPVEEMPDMLGSADVLLALLESDAAVFSVPSKLLSYLCSGRPILLSAPSHNLATRVLMESNGGLHAEALDSEAFVTSANRLRSDHELRHKAGLAGRAYAEENFDVTRIANRFEQAMGVKLTLVLMALANLAPFALT